MPDAFCRSDGAIAPARGLRYRRVHTLAPESAMTDPRTLAVDIGGTGIKLAVLDGAGRIIGEPVRVRLRRRRWSRKS